MSEKTTAVSTYDADYAKAMEQYADEWQRESGNFISTKSGVLTYRAGDEDIELPGNQLLAVILDAVHENTFYEGVYDADNPQPPVCYAYTRNKKDGMYPHESMQNHPDYFDAKSDTCNTCPNNEWGSADVGKGKACKNRARLALIPAGMFVPRPKSRDFDIELFDKPQDMTQADILMLKLPPTSVAEWEKYVQQIGASVRRPPYGVITRVYIEPHAKHQFHVKFEMIEPLPDDLFQAVFARQQEAGKTIITAYTPPEVKEQAAPKQNGLRGLRR